MTAENRRTIMAKRFAASCGSVSVRCSLETTKINLRQANGMRGVYLVASELVHQGLIASPTSRSARGADILATRPDLTRAFSVEVKSGTNNKYWLLAQHAKNLTARSHIYVFARVLSKQSSPEDITYFPVASKFVADHCRLPDPSKPEEEQYRRGYSIDLQEIEKFKNDWTIFGV
jgi:hypothetical protein